MNKFLAAIIFVFIIGCNSKNNQQANTNPLVRANSKDSAEMISGVDADDIKMNMAMSTAKATYNSFLQKFIDSCNGCEDFMVKMRFSDGDANVEHMWLSELKMKGNKLIGELVGTPEVIARLHPGDFIEVNKDSLSDWYYVQNGKMVGGYTIRYFYNKMSKEEQLKMEQDMGVEIE
jgi:uncharacterized protein YegJ (DUF2314 family)